MNGLDNITKAIIDDATTQADEILAQAKQKSDEIMRTAEAEANSQQTQIMSLAEKKVNGIKESAQSFCELDRKNELLKAKMALIEETLQKAVQTLCDLPDDEYFSVMKKLIAANVIKGDGVLVLNSRDLSRVKPGFMDSVGAALAGNKSLSLCKTPNDSIKGGCILKYDEIEINLGFDMIIASQKEQLIDKVNSTLFN